MDTIYPEFDLLVGKSIINTTKEFYGYFVNFLKEETGGVKQWIRVGASFSRNGNFHTRTTVRWGASPKYKYKIKNKTLRKVNQNIRRKKLPGNSWRVQDPGHLHIKK